jgi:hypothetical protein
MKKTPVACGHLDMEVHIFLACKNNQYFSFVKLQSIGKHYRCRESLSYEQIIRSSAQMNLLRRCGNGCVVSWKYFEPITGCHQLKLVISDNCRGSVMQPYSKRY